MYSCWLFKKKTIDIDFDNSFFKPLKVEGRFFDSDRKLIIKIVILDPQYVHSIVLKNESFVLVELHNVPWKDHSVFTE